MLIFKGLRTTVLALVLLISLSLAAIGARAQSDASVQISPPQTGDFPTISFNASVSDGTGRRVENLPASSFQIMEDGRSITPSSVQEARVGTR
ncbi:MAG: hypothetical protein ACLFWD_11350, partial [Anaerolineales bacterium]